MENWRRLRGYCEACGKEMRPVSEARCVTEYYTETGAVVKCTGKKCDNKDFVWDTTA